MAGVRTADAGPRLGARILDWLIVGIPFGLLGFALGYYDTSPVADPTAPGSVWTPVTVALSIGELVARFVYHAAFLAMKGATPGKMVCGIRAVSYTHLDVYKRQPLASATARARSGSPAAPIAIGAGNRVSGSAIRVTTPPSWSMPTAAGQSRPVRSSSALAAAATACIVGTRSALSLIHI